MAVARLIDQIEGQFQGLCGEAGVAQLEGEAVDEAAENEKQRLERLEFMLAIIASGEGLRQRLDLQGAGGAAAGAFPEFESGPADYGNTESALVGSVCGWWLSVRRTFADEL